MIEDNNLEYVSTELAAIPKGHYSQAIIHNSTVYVAMQLAINPDGTICNGTAHEQTKIVLNNIKNILVAAGSSLNKVIKVTIYLSDISMWDEIDNVYKDIFQNHKPARGVVSVNKLHLGLDVGCEMIAAL